MHRPQIGWLVKGQKMSAAARPKLPFFSECIIILMNSIVAVFHYVAPSYSSTISTAMIGGLFALMIPPAVLVYIVILTLNVCIPQLNGNASYYIGLPLLLLYLLQIWVIDKSQFKPLPLNSNRGPRTSLEYAAFHFWSTHFKYFPITLVADDKVQLPPTKQYVFAVHPHGIHCWPLNLLTFIQSPFDVRFPGLVGDKLTGLAASVIFFIPVIRELFLNMGYVDAGRKVAQKVLDSGRSLYVCTGGEEESMR